MENFSNLPIMFLDSYYSYSDAAVTGGFLAAFLGFGAVMILVLLLIAVAFWFISCAILKGALNKLDVPVTKMMYVPIANTWHMVSKLDTSAGTFKLLGSSIPSNIVRIGATFFWVLLFVPVIGSFLMIVGSAIFMSCIYTRIYDIADGEMDGKNGVIGLVSALIGIVYLIKIIMILLNSSNHTFDEFMTVNGYTYPIAGAPAKTAPQQKFVKQQSQQQFNQPQQFAQPQPQQFTQQQFNQQQPQQFAQQPQQFAQQQPQQFVQQPQQFAQPQSQQLGMPAPQAGQRTSIQGLPKPARPFSQGLPAGQKSVVQGLPAGQKSVPSMQKQCRSAGYAFSAGQMPAASNAQGSGLQQGSVNVAVNPLNSQAVNQPVQNTAGQIPANTAGNGFVTNLMDGQESEEDITII